MTELSANQPAHEKLAFGNSKKIPLILQTESAECGLACLAMVAGCYGFETDMTILRRKYSVSSHGMNLKQLIGMATKMNLNSRALKLDIENIAELQTPCILHWDLNHFVVLKRATSTKVYILDPAIGERTLSIEELGKHFTGVALELTPSEDFEQGEEVQKLKLSSFWSQISGLKRTLLKLFALSLFLQLFALLSPFYMQTVVDDVLMRKDVNLLLTLSIGFALLMLIELGTSILRQYIMMHMSNKLRLQMSANLFRHLIRLPMSYFEKRHMGDIVSRFGSLGAIQGVITTGVIAAILDGFMAIITLIAMFVYDVKLTLIVMSVVFLYGLMRYILYRPFRTMSEEQIVSSAKQSSHFMESIRAVQTIKLFQKEDERQIQWQNKMVDTMNKGIRIQRWEIAFGSVNSLLFGFEKIIIIYFAAMLVIDDMMTVGMLYAFMSYKGRFSGAANSLIGQWINLKMLDIHLGRLSDIAYTEVESGYSKPLSAQLSYLNADSQSAANDQVQLATGKIELKDCSFSYGDAEEMVFSDINITIQPGETVAIVGPSGCGKTTLLKCMMGLLTPTSGKVYVDDTKVDNFYEYRSRIGGVMQEDQLLSGSISDNISCFGEKVDFERIVDCAKRACIHDEIMQMPMQYNTLVGDLGTSLSGGQKQRVVLARALYRNPQILFMDEATSHLDITNESLVNHNIKQMDITRVIVAHRPETIKSADRIIDMGQLIS